MRQECNRWAPPGSYFAWICCLGGVVYACGSRHRAGGGRRSWICWLYWWVGEDGMGSCWRRGRSFSSLCILIYTYYEIKNRSAGLDCSLIAVVQSHQ